MRIAIEEAKLSELPDELKRRRAAVIDALVEELQLREHEVNHAPQRLLRSSRHPTDELKETVLVNGIPVTVAVKAMGDSGTPRNKLRLSFGYTSDAQRWQQGHISVQERAAEPKKGFDPIALADKVEIVIERIAEQQARNDDHKRNREVAEHLDKALRRALGLNAKEGYCFRASVSADQHGPNGGPCVGPQVFHLHLRGLARADVDALVAAVGGIELSAHGDHC